MTHKTTDIKKITKEVIKIKLEFSISELVFLSLSSFFSSSKNKSSNLALPVKLKIFTPEFP